MRVVLVEFRLVGWSPEGDMAIGFSAVIMLSLASALLDAAGLGDPRQSLQLIFTVGLLVWIGALTIKTSRVR